MNLPGVPKDTTEKDLMYQKTGQLIKQTRLLINKTSVNICGLPSVRALDNIKYLIGNFPCSYFGFENDPELFKKTLEAYSNHSNIKMEYDNIVSGLNKKLFDDISIYSLDFCGALPNELEVIHLCDGIEATRSPDTVVIQLTLYAGKRFRRPNCILDELSKRLSNVQATFPADYYIGKNAERMAVYHIILSPKRPIHHKSLGDFLLDSSELDPEEQYDSVKLPRVSKTKVYNSIREFLLGERYSGNAFTKKYKIMTQAMISRYVSGKIPETSMRGPVRARFKELEKEFNCTFAWL